MARSSLLMLRIPRLSVDFSSGERGGTKAAAVAWVSIARVVAIGVSSFDDVEDDVSSDVDVVDGVVDGMNEFSSNPHDVMNELDSNSKQFGRFEISCCIHRDKNFRPS